MKVDLKITDRYSNVSYLRIHGRGNVSYQTKSGLPLGLSNIAEDAVALELALEESADAHEAVMAVRQYCKGVTTEVLPRKREAAPQGGSAACPMCDSVNLDVSNTDFVSLNRGDVRLGIACLHCGATWRGQYRLTAYQHIERQGQQCGDQNRGHYGA